MTVLATRPPFTRQMALPFAPLPTLPPKPLRQRAPAAAVPSRLLAPATQPRAEPVEA